MARSLAGPSYDSLVCHLVILEYHIIMQLSMFFSHDSQLKTPFIWNMTSAVQMVSLVSKTFCISFDNYFVFYSFKNCFVYVTRKISWVTLTSETFKPFELWDHILRKFTNLHLTVLNQSCSVIQTGTHCLQKNAGFAKLSKYLQVFMYLCISVQALDYASRFLVCKRKGEKWLTYTHIRAELKLRIKPAYPHVQSAGVWLLRQFWQYGEGLERDLRQLQ